MKYAMNHLPERQAAVERRQVHHGETEAAGLRHHAHRAAGVVRVEHRTETRVHRIGGIDHALAVGADDADIILLRDLGELLLRRHAGATHFRETRTENDHVRNAALAARRQHVGHARGIDQDQRQFRRFGQRFQRRPAFDAGDLLVFRVDRIKLALVAVAQQVFQRLAADGREVLRRADDGDGSGTEKSFDVGAHGVA
jgi:hypothetical protein